MEREVFPIFQAAAGRLAIVVRPAPRSVGETAAAWRAAGLDLIVSLLEDAEASDMGLAREAGACQQVGIRFARFPIPDRGVPKSPDDLSRFVEWLAAELQAGAAVGIHCRMGIGRSALVAACLLVSLGHSVESAWALVQQGRRVPVPHTPWQREWVAEWALRYQRPDAQGGGATRSPGSHPEPLHSEWTTHRGRIKEW
jgi:protein-tyrosine phosphatase